MRPHSRRLAASPMLALSFAVSACAGAAPNSGPSNASAPATSAAAAASTASASTGTDLVADIDIGGRTLHLVCLGPTTAGEPTVVLESGLGAPYSVWSQVLTAMQAKHRVCAYDRAGLGASPPAPEASRTAADVVADLHTLLTKAGVAGPYLMVGHSFAAWPIAVYAKAHPDDVAGAVFIDPRGPKVSRDWLAALPAASASEAPAVAANRDELGAFEHDPSMNDEHLDLTASSDEAVAALDAPGPLFGDHPVVVLGAANTHTNWADLPPAIAASFDTIWLDGQKALAAESTAGSFAVVPDSDHEIQADQPATVVKTIESVLAGLGS